MKPSGLITFLFTDIEGSTKLSQEFPDTINTALEIHNSILRNTVESCNGFVFKIVGDAYCCAFHNAADAVKAAVEIQRSLAFEKWKDAVIRVRIGIHSGNAEWNGVDYMGYITLARVARIMSVAYGEQILISDDAVQNCIKGSKTQSDLSINGEKSNQNKTEKDSAGSTDLSVGQFSGEKITPFNISSGHRVFETKEISFRDLGERRLKDVIQPIRLYQAEAEGLRKEFPPLKTLDARPNNLPVQLTSYIGRENVFEKVKEMIGKTHLLTILGPGGGGKTRLATQIAADLIDEFENGVFITELAPISNPSMIIQNIITSVGIKEESGQSMYNSLLDYLRDKEMLIILDNCEHLINECAELTENLLINCKKLKLIATSREALNCSGEQIFKIPMMSVPSNLKELSADDLYKFESTHLFLERAYSVNPNFKLSKENSIIIAEICRHLDGIPLAIELAAAGSKFLSVENIRDRLDDRFKLLTGGKRTALPKHKTLKAMIDWSYELLSEKEKLLWERLSVFKGGCDLEAAEEICSDEKIKKSEILDLLAGLAEKSIINYNLSNNRYSILETIKKYGEEKLKDNNGYDDFSKKHLNYYYEYSKKAESKLLGSEILLWLEKLEADHLNFQSAIEWSVKNSETEKGAGLAVALRNFWELRGYHSTGRKLYTMILGNPGELSKPLSGKVYLHSAKFAWFKGDYDQARNYYNESLAISNELGDKLSIASALTGLGNIEYNLNNYKSAREYYEASLNLRRETGDRYSIARSLNNLGNLAFRRYEYEESEKYYKEYFDLSTQMNDKRGISSALHNLGSLEFEKGDFEKGKIYTEQSLEIRKELGDKVGIAELIYNLGKVFSLQNNYEESKKYFQECISIYRDLGHSENIANALYSLGYLESSAGNYQQAADLFEESSIIALSIKNKSLLTDVLYGMGCNYLYMKNYKLSRKILKECLHLSIESDDKLKMANVLIAIAGINEPGADLSGSAKLFGAADAELLSLGNHPEDDELKLKEMIKKELIDKLGEERFNKHFEEGKSMLFEEAINIAVDS